MLTGRAGQFEVDFHEEGQLYIRHDDGETRFDAAVQPGTPPSIQVGCDQPIEFDKLYGPLIFASIRVRADRASGDWIIERCYGPGEGEWREAARIPGQLEEDFA